VSLLPVVLVLLGLAFVVAEVFFVSFGLLSLVAGGLILVADILAFRDSEVYGWSLVAAEVVLVPVLVKGAFHVLPRLPFGRRMLLGAPRSRPEPGVPALGHLQGRRGRASSDLRPAGTAIFGEERVSVVSVAGLVPLGTEVLVVAVEGTEVRVLPVPAPSRPSP